MFGLSFLYPAFLIGAAVAAVPILLHLLKRETAPPLLFSAVRFLKRAPEERSRRKRLRELLLLALRVSALVLLAAAFARPYLTSGAAGPTGVTIVAVDTSFSLSSPGRFDRARALAREAIDQTETGRLVGVVAFSDEAALVTEPSLDRGAARAALDRLEPGFGATRYRAALDRSIAAIEGRTGDVVLVTDLQRTGWRADAGGAVPAGVAVRVVDVGDLPSNLAVTTLVREAGRAVAVVRNGGAGARKGRVRLSVGERPVADKLFDVEPGASVDVTFDIELPATGVARASLDDPTGYAADDSRYLTLDPPVPAALLVVTPTGNLTNDALYFDRALDAVEGARRFRLQGTSGGALAGAEHALDSVAAVALLTTRGLDRQAGDRLRAFVQNGGGLFVAAGDDLEPERLTSLLGELAPPLARVGGGQVSPVTLAPVDARHPIVRPFGALRANLGQARFRRALGIDDRGWQTIARFSDGAAALVERRAGRGRVVFFASDLNNRWNDFPLQPTFVPFLHETMRYLTNDRREPSSFAVGDAPAGAPRRPGIVTIGNPPRRVTINVDARESDPGRLSEEEFLASLRRAESGGEADAPSMGRQVEAEQGYWRYALAFVLVTLMVEGIVGRKT